MPTCLPRNRASASSSSLRRSCPATITAPLSGRSNPVITISRVDLPEPDGPSSATASPRPICRVTSRRIRTRAAPRPSDRLTSHSVTASPAPAEEDPEMSFMRSTGPSVRPSYGWRRAVVQFACGLAACSVVFMAATAPRASGAGTPIRLVVLRRLLTARPGPPATGGFVPRLQAALAADGVAAEVANAGVSGDTAADGLARLDWSVPQGTDAVIIELGANDMLRGIKPQVTRAALDVMLQRLTARHVTVLLCGMRAAPNLGAAYGDEFARTFPELAVKYGVALYPFFLDGVAADRKLLQPDGMHPNAAGVGVIVERILPQVRDLIARAAARRAS